MPCDKKIRRTKDDIDTGAEGYDRQICKEARVESGGQKSGL